MVLVNVLGKWRVFCTNRLFKFCFSFQRLLFFFSLKKVLFFLLVCCLIVRFTYILFLRADARAKFCSCLQFSIATYVIFIIFFSSIAWLPVLVHFYSKTKKNWKKQRESEQKKNSKCIKIYYNKQLIARKRFDDSRTQSAHTILSLKCILINSNKCKHYQLSSTVLISCEQKWSEIEKLWIITTTTINNMTRVTLYQNIQERYNSVSEILHDV